MKAERWPTHRNTSPGSATGRAPTPSFHSETGEISANYHNIGFTESMGLINGEAPISEVITLVFFSSKGLLVFVWNWILFGSSVYMYVCVDTKVIPRNVQWEFDLVGRLPGANDYHENKNRKKTLYLYHENTNCSLSVLSRHIYKIASRIIGNFYVLRSGKHTTLVCACNSTNVTINFDLPFSL